MKKLLLVGLMMLAGFALAENQIPFEESEKCLDSADKKIELIIPIFKDNKELEKTNRKPTEREQSVIKKWLDDRSLCFNYQDTSNDPRIDSSVMLSLGVITFSEYIYWQEKGYEAYIAYRKREPQNLSSTKKPAPSTTLACLADNPSAFAGLEFQYQINEENKTVLATRGEQPSQIYIDSIRVMFAQGKGQTNISRSTGRFSVEQGAWKVTGNCQLIK